MTSFFLCALLAAPAPSPSPSPTAETLVDRAIKAAGGEAALRRAAVLAWRGRATVHAGDQPLRLEGRWLVEPPDRAVVTTWAADKGPSSARRLILQGAEGFLERNGARTPMPAAMLANERDQFYLYALMRLLPLKDPAVTLSLTGPRSIRVEREGRPTAEMTFDFAGGLDSLRADVRDPQSTGTIAETLTFEGLVQSRGVAWPLRISMAQNGAPFFDLELTEFRVTSAAELEREAQAPARRR
jgi:hypothetical protein